jgi:hypothetical protein
MPVTATGPAVQVIMFCTNAGFSAGAPGKATQNLQFALPPRNSDRVDDENPEVFADPTQRAANLNLNGVKDSVMAKFAAAPRVRVTIEIIE